MTEYWQSQARKYCEFCKCWFADNKVSISFHENGKRHKEAVQKHISQLSKRSAKEAKQQEKVDDDMKRMEEAALAAYAQDVQNNADLTSQHINEMLGTNSQPEPLVSASAPASRAASVTVWHEVNNNDGSSYYWNTQNNETTWDPPDEYLSVAEQEEIKLKEADKKKKEEQIKKQKQKEESEAKKKELKAFASREKNKQKGVKNEPLPQSAVSSVTAVSFGPAPRSDKPYGQWTAVATEPVEQLDLQLPKGKELPPPPVEVQPEIIKFGEKRVQSLGEGPVDFKKRKINNPKRNMRQKLHDD